ncbi:VanZ family protein [Vibrio ponticus]|uniref:VanZ family protein n=1 Tax=Vibrio ponticus TaxID=265668 RepID=A0A3N3DXI8_9VIBR|nr:VanZ family protein [Vibrio ponticus]ROV59255.1 VanZ family protein [Vibrio ponticus]
MRTSHLVVHRRLPFLCLLVAFGAGASIAKSLQLQNGIVSQFEYMAGGDLVMHAVMALLLGWAANWSTPTCYFRYYGFFRLTPLLALMLLAVSIDETLQAFISTRQFSLLDLCVNIGGLLIGAFSHRLYLLTRGI